MNKSSVSPQASLACTKLAPSLDKSRTTEIIRATFIVFLGSVFVAICSHIALPLWFTPVPLTLQPLAVLVIGMLLTPRLAATTLFAYLAEGVAGLPVFAPGLAFSTGFAHLFGPTGGYLLVYPAAAFLVAVLWRRGARTYWSALFSAASGNLLILAGGALWLSALTHATVKTAVALAVIPFLPGDALKIAVAAALATGWVRLRDKN
ncbi:MAG: biotin transporter BioY [Acidobacteriota bacterium]|nr:biotin transporter BioY [Acidobacteriota bacterium]